MKPEWYGKQFLSDYHLLMESPEHNQNKDQGNNYQHKKLYNVFYVSTEVTIIIQCFQSVFVDF